MHLLHIEQWDGVVKVWSKDSTVRSRKIYSMIPARMFQNWVINIYYIRKKLTSLENRAWVIEKASPLYFPIKVRIQYLCSKMGKTKELIKIKARRPPGSAQPGFAEFLIIARFSPARRYFWLFEYFCPPLPVSRGVYSPPITENAGIWFFLVYFQDW